MADLLAYRLRAELRERWRTLLGLVVLVTVLGGIVLTSAAGARRTSSAYERFLDFANPPELTVSPPGGPGSDTRAFFDTLAHLDGVRTTRQFAGLPVLPESGTPSERLAEAFGGIGVVAALDGAPGTGIGRPRIVSGRLPRADRADEVMVSQRLAEIGDLQVGDHIDVVLSTEDETDAATADDDRRMTLTVTGIGVVFDEVVPFSDLNESGSILATAPLAELIDRTQWNFEGAFVDAEPGADLTAMTSAIERIGAENPSATGGDIFVSDQASAAQQVSDAMRPLAVSIAVAAAAVAFVALFVVGQAVSRTSREPPGERDALRALGARTRDRVAFASARAAVVGIVGAAGAIVVAVALSDRFPIGIARVAEPDPGMQVDAAVLAFGAAAIVAVTVASCLPVALRRARTGRPQPRPSWLAGAAASRGLSPAAVQGVRFAVLGGGPRPVPMRSTLLAVTIAITAVLATITFGDSLVKLIDTPSRYGQGWDRMVDAQFGPAPVGRVLARFRTDPIVRGIAAGNYGDVTVNGVPVPGFDLVSLHGEVSVAIDEGRAAQTVDEIVLGGETIDRLGVRVGDMVAVDTGQGARPMQLTGSGVFPRMGQGSFSTTGLGVGAQIGGPSLVSFGDFDTVPPDYEVDGERYNFVTVDLAGPPAARDGEFLELEAATVADEAFAFTRREQPPTKIRDLDRVRLVPGATAAALALVGVAALAHLLLTSVRERRRELALLQTLGFSRRQLHATVVWQAAVIALAALAIGAPLGIVVGRAIWRRFADGLYTIAPAETPWAWLLVVIVATVIVAILVAALPGRSAARTRPAVVLRDE